MGSKGIVTGEEETMPVLVAYATKHGSTQGIAERIADTLGAGGLDVDLAAVSAAVDPEGYEAFVIGSAVYASRWMKPAVEFVQHNRALLAARPAWLFSVGPLGRKIPLPAKLPSALAGLSESIGVRDHHVFRGALDVSKLRGAEHLIRLFLPQGDFRDWQDIEAWAKSIAGELCRAPAPQPPHAPRQEDGSI
jgi:menaquinone-dependent protoporphyrinogen oxidase